jgi:hypothetical protein
MYFWTRSHTESSNTNDRQQPLHHTSAVRFVSGWTALVVIGEPPGSGSFQIARARQSVAMAETDDPDGGCGLINGE